jgi:tetratricopeptide (TPR) repeat protein
VPALELHAVVYSRQSSYKKLSTGASAMHFPQPSLLGLFVTAIAVCFSISGAAASVEHVRTQAESVSSAADPGSGADIEEGLARVNAARASPDADPLALEEALTALGDAYLEANQYAAAEAAYVEAVRSAEQHSGRDAPRVLTPLTGLGTTRARAGHHHDAIPLLQRAVAITRAQFGMFDLRQQDVLETLAGSLTALNRQQEAQDAMTYRVRAAEKTYGEGSPKIIPWLCDLGDWFAENGKTPEARMTFQVALNIAGARDSLHAPIIVAPLRGIARAYMLRSSYPDSWRKPPYPTFGCGIPYAVLPPECKDTTAFDAEGFNIGPRTLNQEGEEALKRALRILEADPDLAPATLIDTLIQMGDWHEIKKSPREALTYYERAWQLIRTKPNLPQSSATALNVPLRVYYPTPQILAHVPTLAAAVDTQSHYVQTEFTVAADGSVRDARIVAHDTRDRYARDILKAVRNSRFRPKFVDGQAVAATGITYRQVFWLATPRD